MQQNHLFGRTSSHFRIIQFTTQVADTGTDCCPKDLGPGCCQLFKLIALRRLQRRRSNSIHPELCWQRSDGSEASRAFRELLAQSGLSRRPLVSLPRQPLRSPCTSALGSTSRKAMTNLDGILKSRDITLPTKVCIVKAVVFLVVMYGYKSWTIKKAKH